MEEGHHLVIQTQDYHSNYCLERDGDAPFHISPPEAIPEELLVKVYIEAVPWSHCFSWLLKKIQQLESQSAGKCEKTMKAMQAM